MKHFDLVTNGMGAQSEVTLARVRVESLAVYVQDNPRGAQIKALLRSASLSLRASENALEAMQLLLEEAVRSQAVTVRAPALPESNAELNDSLKLGGQ